MIFADKLIRLRKKSGWSQEELAEKMNVSRQAVSKWEGAQAVPDLDKMLMLSRLFGVTTDYLLKDELEGEEFTDEIDNPVRQVSLDEANAYLEWRRTDARWIASATFICIISPIPMLLLAILSECPPNGIPLFGLTENVAGGVGLILLLILVAIAVAIFSFCGFKNSPYDFLEKEPFELLYGVAGMVKERQKSFHGAYTRLNIIATCLCILSPIALFIGAILDDEFFTVVMLTVTMLIAGIGVVFFILAGVPWTGIQKLLKEGDYSKENRRKNKYRETISAVYWLSATAIFLGWSFLTDSWDISWIVWPIAGVLFAGVMVLCNLFLDRNRD